MLAFRMKKPLSKVDFEARLSAAYDTAKWGPVGKELIQRASGMRERAREASQGYDAKGADECRQVFGLYQALIFQLEAVCAGVSLKEKRVEFQWDDAFEASKPHAEADLSFERACVLFNLAACISFLGNRVDRTAEGGPKQACHHYQQAAGCLSECLKLVREGAWAASADMSADTLGVLSALMLAQAQKCFVEKAERDGMASATLAKLIAECSALYEQVGRGFDDARAKGRAVSKMNEGWLKVVEYNRSMWDGMQHFHLAKAHQAAAEYGKALSRLTYAVNKTAEAVNACSDAAPELQEQFKRAHAQCREAYDAAKKDNDLVHYEKVPPIDTLPKPARHCLVKPMLPDEVANNTAPTPLPPIDGVAVPDVSDYGAGGGQSVGQSMGQSMGGGGGTLEGAMGGISLGGGSSATSGAAADEPPPPSFEAAEEAGLRALMAMGFERAAASDALAKAGGSVHSAAEILLGKS